MAANPTEPRYAPLARPRINLPNRLKELRERGKHCQCGLWLSQLEVAHMLGYNHSTVSLHESGERGLTADDVKRYARLYKVLTWEIFATAEEMGRTEMKAQTGKQSRRSNKLLAEIKKSPSIIQPDDGDDDLTTLFRKK